MGQNITESRELAPGNRRFIDFQWVGKMFDRFADDFKLPDDRVLGFGIIFKCRLVEAANIDRDPLAGLDNVFQTLVRLT